MLWAFDSPRAQDLLLMACSEDRMEKYKKLKSIKASCAIRQTDEMCMAVSLSSGETGKRVKKGWNICSDGDQLLFLVDGSKTWVADLMPLLRLVLAAEGVK